MERCKNSNPAAQRILYDRYVNDMMILCLRYLPQSEDAREAMNDAFLSFFRNIAGFEYRGDGSLKAWLKKITVNQCLARLRKVRRMEIALDDAVHGQEEDDDSVFGWLAAKEMLKLLQELPDGYRTVFNLYVFEDMGHREIGELLGISENTSKSQLHRARQLMKTKLGHNK